MWRDAYEDDEVTGFAVINFWRTVYMDEPLRHLPLALLDRNSVDEDDIVFSGLSNFMQTKGITNQMSLRYNPEQRWYYFPYMTTDEVIAFRNFECHKDGRRALRTCFHAAFPQPEAKEPFQMRQSCEYRVSVFFLKG